MRKAKVPDTGTVCTYSLQGDSFHLTLHGRKGMPKIHREESETSEDPNDLEEHHDLLAEIFGKVKDCSEGKFLYVDYTETKENEGNKGYAKLLYLKLALWCKKHDIHFITGMIGNTEAIPLILREKIPGARNRIWIKMSDEETIKTARNARVKLTRSHCPFRNIDMMEVMNQPLNQGRLKACVPCYVATELT
jgi:hypothetical protein